MHIVLVETTTPRGMDLVQELSDLGVEVSLVVKGLGRHLRSDDAERLALARRIIEVAELGSGCDLAAILRSDLGPNPPDGVICRDEIYAAEVAGLTKALGVPGETVETAELLSDKSAVRQRLQDVGIGSVRWARVSSVDEAVVEAKRFGYPVVVKPTRGGYSLGVAAATDEDELASSVETALSTMAGLDNPAVLIEEKLDGRLISAEMMVQHGKTTLLGFGERVPTPDGITAEIGGHFPAMFEGMDEVEQFARSVVEAVGIGNSAVHLEMLVSPDRTELVEINGRVAGYVVMQQMTHALGRSVAQDLLRVAIGEPLEPMGEPVACAAIRSLWAAQPLRVLDVLPSQPLHRDVVLSDLQVAAGDRLARLRSNSDRFGYVVALGVDGNDADRLASTTADSLMARLVVTPDPKPEPRIVQRRDRRLHVLMLDRIGPSGWTRESSRPLLTPDRFRLSVISSAELRDDAEQAHTDLLVKADVFDTDEVAKIARRIHADDPVDRVAALSERLLEPAAELRQEFGAGGDSRVQVNRYIDKAVMKQLARQAGIRYAAGGIVRSVSDVVRHLDRHGKVVVKPRAGSGSRGMAILTSKAAAIRWADECFEPDTFLMEEYVSNQMCHIDAVVWDGHPIWNISLYLNDTASYRRGEPLSGVTLDDRAMLAAADDMLTRIISTWRIDAAVLHLEVFPTDAGLVFCEMAGRPGGAAALEQFEITRGLNIDHSKILIDSGEDPRQLLKRPVADHAGYTIHYTRSGTLVDFDDSSIIDETYFKRMSGNVGEHVAQSKFSGSGLSAHVFTGSDTRTIRDLVDRAEKEITVTVEAESDWEDFQT